MSKYHESATFVPSLTNEEIWKWLNSFDTVLSDCDGVLWLYNEVLKGSPEVMNKFTKMGKKIFLVTNNSTKTRFEFYSKARRMGYNVNRDHLLSSSYLAAQYLKDEDYEGPVYMIGTEGMAREFELAGLRPIGDGPDVMTKSLYDMVHSNIRRDPDVGAVVVGFDEHFSFPKMLKAASYLSDPECHFVATNLDSRLPMPGCVVPETGAIVRSIEVSADREATVVGKPNEYICEWIAREYGIRPEKTLMIGDNCTTDILLGKNCGFQTLMVESGIHKYRDVKRYMASDDEEQRRHVPDMYVKRLSDLLPVLARV